MDPEPIIARRATLEDLPGLQALWQRSGLPWEQLEKFFTEFQIVPGDGGVALAAVGLLVEGSEGLLHSEAIIPADSPDPFRAALWKRILIVARNHGAVRIWTQEDAPFWQQQGFSKATAVQLADLKTTFADPSASWVVCQVIDPAKASQKIAQTMALWEASRQSESEDLKRKIQNFRNGAFILAAVVIGAMLLIAIYVFLRRPDLLQQLFRGRR
jgi:N-acetylglutamate synthase-like GNAT family acetyltransferase